MAEQHSDLGTYRYTFKEGIRMDEVKDSLFMAAMAAESLHGRSQVHLDASFCLNEADRTCLIGAGTPVGQDIARIFTGYLEKEFGEQAFQIERRHRQLSDQEAEEVYGAVADVLQSLLKEQRQQGTEVADDRS